MTKILALLMIVPSIAVAKNYGIFDVNDNVVVVVCRNSIEVEDATPEQLRKCDRYVFKKKYFYETGGDRAIDEILSKRGD